MPHTLIVSYEIGWDDDATYNKLRNALHNAVIADLDPADYWLETTSFYVVRTEEASNQLASRVVRDAKLRRARDKLLVINISGKGGRAWGAIEDADLYRLLPFVKKL